MSSIFIRRGDTVTVEGDLVTERMALKVVDGIPVLEKQATPLPTRLGIYTPSQPVSTGAEPTQVRLLMLTNEGWLWLDPSAGGYHVERVTFIETVEKYRDTMKPVALYGELNG